MSSRSFDAVQGVRADAKAETTAVVPERIPLLSRVAPVERTQSPISNLVPLLATASLAVHFIGRNRYGFFRDELYYIACGNHLAFGYVDQPPFVALVARLASSLLGTSLSCFRFLPAVAVATLVLITGWLTRELGGGRFAQALASFVVAFAPIYLAFGSFLSMNAFEPLFCTACAYILVRILKGGDERLWLVYGVVAGVALENKHTMLMFGFAAIVGLLVAGDGKLLRSRWFWCGLLVAFLIFLPNLIWEVQHNWPQFEVVRNCQRLKNTPIGALRFLGEQVLFFNPLTAPVLAAGLGWLLFSKHEKRFRSLGWAYLIVLAVVFMLHGKTYYPAPYYATLFAAGAVAVEALLQKEPLRRAYVSALMVSVLVMLPFSVPIFSLDRLLRYQNLIALQNVVRTEHDSAGEVHQLYADMMGWDSMVATVADVYYSLPPSDRQRCAILVDNYGEAGAIDLLGEKYGLPKAISPHNNYYLWGTKGNSGEVVILFGPNAEQEKTLFASVEQVATISDTHGAISERQLPVYVCRLPQAPLAQLWPSLRHYE